MWICNSNRECTGNKKHWCQCSNLQKLLCFTLNSELVPCKCIYLQVNTEWRAKVTKLIYKNKTLKRQSRSNRLLLAFIFCLPSNNECHDCDINYSDVCWLHRRLQIIRHSLQRESHQIEADWIPIPPDTTSSSCWSQTNFTAKLHFCSAFTVVLFTSFGWAFYTTAPESGNWIHLRTTAWQISHCSASQ